jgi:toxin HigB-1
MINSFTHKGLKKFFVKGDTSGIKQDHKDRLEVRLQFLDLMDNVQDLSDTNWHFHKLKGELRNHYSISMSGNWRLIFIWDEKQKNVEILDYLDYH